MNIISKSDLKYDYSWSFYCNYNLKVKGSFDNTSFNINTGLEMLNFINKYCVIKNINNKSLALKIEEYLQIMAFDSSHTQQKIASFVTYYLDNC